MIVNNIKALREKKGLTQRQLAAQAQTSQQQIQRIEAGVQSAKFDLAARICAALGEPLDRIFPATALPLRRAKKRLGSPEELWADDEANAELEEAGIDMDPADRLVRYKLRGGAQGDLQVLGAEHDRIWAYMNEFDKDEPEGFVVFDSGGRRYAINLDHLVFCQFLWGMPGEFTCPEEEGDDDEPCKVHVVMADSEEPMSFEVEPDNAPLSDETASDNETMLQSIFYEVEAGGTVRFRITDVDGETAWFRIKDVALVSAPLSYVEPELLDAEDDVDNDN